MADAATLIEGRKPAVASAKNPTMVEGRRAFFKYRDLGVTAGSNGHMRAQITSAEGGMSQPTGWHYHLCESQFVYVLKGWLELEFEDRTVRLEEGDSIYIPGGAPHNETRTADKFDILEVSVPAQMATKACDPPRK
ncbi:MAG: cupin domain-containing protein [Pseudomonadota bacterium]|nr:cupin domain-containing protein [Pseudomonadota bacterium]